MTTRSTIKSITSALLLSAIVILSSCKKEDEVDPRDSYVGHYEVEFDLFNENDELEIKKDTENAKVLIINSDLLDDMGIEDLEAEVSGGKIEIERVNFFYNDNGPIYSGKLSGEGKINGNELTIELELECVDRNLDCEIRGGKK